MRSSPSLYEGAFRLETTARPADMFTSSLQATMMIMKDGDHEPAEGGSPLSSPVDSSSYKIRIGPRGSSSPTSHEDETDGKGGGGGEMETEAQDLTVPPHRVDDDELEDEKCSFQPNKLSFEEENCIQ